MAKKEKKTSKAGAPAPPSSIEEGLSPLGKALAAGGGGAVLLGFLVLSRADSLAQNWAGKLSPFLILGGYALIAAGLFLPPSGPPSRP